jgi:hypothetical protein
LGPLSMMLNFAQEFCIRMVDHAESSLIATVSHPISSPGQILQTRCRKQRYRITKSSAPWNHWMSCHTQSPVILTPKPTGNIIRHDRCRLCAKRDPPQFAVQYSTVLYGTRAGETAREGSWSANHAGLHCATPTAG